MNSIQEWIKKNSKLILHIICTVFVCIILYVFFDKNPDFLLTGNLCLSVLFCYCVYRIIYKKIHSDSFLKMICIFAMFISANQFFSYNKLIENFPFLINIKRSWLILGTIFGIIMILLFFKILKEMESYSPLPKEKATDQIQKEALNSSDSNENAQIPSSPIYNPKNDFFSFLRFLCVIVGVGTLLLIPAGLLFLFNKYGLEKDALDFDKVFSFLGSYAFSFISILFAVITVFIIIIYFFKFASMQIRNFKQVSKENSEKPNLGPTYLISVIIAFAIIFFSWRVTNFSIDDLTDKLISANYLALPIAIIITIVFFFLFVKIINAIIIMLIDMKEEEVKESINTGWKKLRIGSRIFLIIQKIIDIILDTILSILKFIKFIPNFFASMSNMVLSNDKSDIGDDVENNEENNETQPLIILANGKLETVYTKDKNKRQRFDSRKEGIQIVKIAAFCFAIVSWFATAQGLYEYVFTEYYWQALLISFGIQAILFVFNLELPAYWKRIGDHFPESQKQHRKWYFGKKKGKEKETFRLVPVQIIIAIFYVIVLGSSSFFSFVYMTNFTYKDTRYADANIKLDSTYRMYLDKTEKYIDEYTKVSQLVISERLSELYKLAINEFGETNAKSKSELEGELDKAKNEHDYCKEVTSNKNEICEEARKTYEEPLSERWRSQEEHAKEWIAYTTAMGELNDAKEKERNAKNALDAAQAALDNYQPNMQIVIQEMLVEILKEDPDPSALETLLVELSENVIQVKEDGTMPINYDDIVTITKELSIAIDNYLLLRELQSSGETAIDMEGPEGSLADLETPEGNTINISDLRREYTNEEIIVPVPSSDDFEQQKLNWEEEWKKRFQSLAIIVKSVPGYSESMINNSYNANGIVENSVSGYSESMVNNSYNANGIIENSASSYSESMVNSLYDANEIIDIETLKDFDGQDIADNIDELTRTNLVNINALERAWRLLFSDFPFLAIFSLIFALFLDFSSLLAGLFIYYTEPAKE